MARGRAMLEWDQTAALWVPAAEQVRDPQSHPEPFTAADINPYRQHEKQETSDEPDWPLWSKLTSSVRVHTIDLSKLNGNRQP